MAVNNRYLIIGYQRSGTTALHTLLSGHPNIACFAGELREPYFSRGLTSFNGGYQTPEEAERGHGLLFDAITGAHVTADTQIQGAKTVCNTANRAAVINDVVLNRLAGIKIIVIERRDLVAQYGSRLVTKRTGVYHSWQKDNSQAKSAAPAPVRIDRHLFKRYAMVVQRTYNEIRKLEGQVPYLHLTHEAFLEDSQSVYQQALDFLGLPVVEPDWFESRKVLPHASTYIQDYERMTELLQQTRADLDAGRIGETEEWMLRGYNRLRRGLKRRKV